MFILQKWTVVDGDSVAVDFTDNNMTDSFKFKENVTGQTDNNGTNNVEAVVPLKYLCNF